MSDQPSLTPASEVRRPSGGIVVLYKAKTAPDADLALTLESGLRKSGHTVFVDRHTSVGLAWAREVEERLLSADLVVALVSAASAHSELLAYQLEAAVQIATRRGGLPRIVPVRVFHKGPLSEALAAVLQPIEFEWDADEERHISRMILWRSPADDDMLLRMIDERMGELRGMEPTGGEKAAATPVRPVPALEPLGGAVPLDSKFYVDRPTDRAFQAAVDRGDSLVLIKGARQMGKTSLLARGLQRARECGYHVVLTDFQKLQSSHLDQPAHFYRALAELIADQLDFDLPEPDRWERNPNLAFESFWTAGLAKVQGTLLWAVDEFDRLFATRFGGEVCGLLRSWHNARALDPNLLWRHLTVAIAYATEAHLFISDLNQSPFNVGTRLALDDFAEAETAELNRRYGSPIADDRDLVRLRQLLGGQPYLLRCAFNEMANHQQDIRLIERLAALEESVFGEHLRRLLYSVGRDPDVTAAVKSLLFTKLPPSPDMFYRLRSAGLIVGAAPSEARIRCGLYDQFLRRHLA